VDLSSAASRRSGHRSGSASRFPPDASAHISPGIPGAGPRARGDRGTQHTAHVDPLPEIIYSWLQSDEPHRALRCRRWPSALQPLRFSMRTPMSFVTSSSITSRAHPRVLLFLLALEPRRIDLRLPGRDPVRPSVPIRLSSGRARKRSPIPVDEAASVTSRHAPLPVPPQPTSIRPELHREGTPGLAHSEVNEHVGASWGCSCAMGWRSSGIGRERLSRRSRSARTVSRSWTSHLRGLPPLHRSVLLYNMAAGLRGFALPREGYRRASPRPWRWTQLLRIPQ